MICISSGENFPVICFSVPFAISDKKGVNYLVKIMILVWALIFSNFKFTNGFNIDLIFSLQENFHSDVVLLENQHENGLFFNKNFVRFHKNLVINYSNVSLEKTVKKLLQYQGSQPKALIGLFDLNNYKIDSFGLSKYHNELVIFDNENDFIKKLFKVRLVIVG